MQEEVKKHTKKIHEIIKIPKHTFIEKIKEITVEIFIIIFAVTLSISLHSWSEHREQQKEAVDFMFDLKDDLGKDIKNMAEEKRKLTQSLKEYTILSNMTKKQLDSLTDLKQQINFSTNFISRKTSVGNYEGFKSSGKIGYIQNKYIKKKILQYYQENMPKQADIEEGNNMLVNKLMDVAIQNNGENKMVLDPKFKISIILLIQCINSNIRYYNQNINDAKTIIFEINKK
jgi:hypothetical protein